MKFKPDKRKDSLASIEKEVQNTNSKKDKNFRLTGWWQKYIRLEDGFAIYEVDGNWIRNNLKQANKLAEDLHQEAPSIEHIFAKLPSPGVILTPALPVFEREPRLNNDINLAARIVREAHDHNAIVIAYDRLIKNADLDFYLAFQYQS